jgi:monoamine oxidase
MAQFLRGLLGSVTAVPMFKAYLCYPQPWWESLGFVAGKAVTDMPLRQCYYWGVEGEQEGADKTNTNALLMAPYSDVANEPYWAALSKMDPLPPSLKTSNPNGPPDLASADWADYRARLTSPLVAELQRQLRSVHGLTPPDPYDAAFVDWGADPFGGARHAWNVHVKSWEAIPSIAHPLATLPIFICGEAYSAKQGNVEGALETAELVLQKCFDLARPGWITASPGSKSAEA